MYIPKAEFDSKKPPQYSARERERARVYDIEYSVVVKHEHVRNCVHSHNYTRSQRSNKRERASERVRVLNANGMLLNTQAQYTVRVPYRERKRNVRNRVVQRASHTTVGIITTTTTELQLN